MEAYIFSYFLFRFKGSQVKEKEAEEFTAKGAFPIQEQ